MKKAILFDLGNTLIKYYTRSEFPHILREAIEEVYNFLLQNVQFDISFDEIWQRVSKENYESSDYKVRPLEERLKHIFTAEKLSDDLIMNMCRCFMKPIFSRSEIYEDTLSVLAKLNSKGIKSVIISNTAWGSPSELWHEEIKRFGIDRYIDLIVFCRDVGWRKPDKRIFEFALKSLSLNVNECVFIGDDPRWDIAGPKAIGMEAILIDRESQFGKPEEKRITTLYEVLDMLVIEK
jgi:putative hydrolase of the HAD superfamily